MTGSGSRAAVSGLDRAALVAERALRSAGDARVAVGLLLLAALANAVAAFDPRLRWVLDSPAYLAVVGAVLLSGVAAVAVRTPSVWREWRRPSPIASRRDTLEATIATPVPTTPDQRAAIDAALRRLGYRTTLEAGRRPAIHGTRRGWSRFAALASHLAFVLIGAGAALGAAFADETVFSLLPGEQALLGDPRPGFTSSVRLERFEGEFGPSGRPERLDTAVTFVREGRAVASQVLRVNEPGSFDGHLVHAWTYGPASIVRVVDLAGRPLADAGVPLDATSDDAPTGFVELPSIDATLGVTLVDAESNAVRVTLADPSGAVDSAVVAPGAEQRLGEVLVTVRELTSYVTFMSRSDPGMLPLFAGAVVLVASLAVAYYLPRRRCSVRFEPSGVLVQVRGERFEAPHDELARIRDRIAATL